MLKRRIPTLLGLALLLILLGGSVFGVKVTRRYITKAGPGSRPQNVRISNITDTSFTLSYITNDPTTGAINLSGLGTIADDREQSPASGKLYRTHYFTINALRPATKYSFSIVSGETTYRNSLTNNQPYAVTTASAGGSTALADPVYGTVSRSDGSPAAGAVVYLNLPGVSPLSGLVKDSGSFLVPVGLARSADLSQAANIQSNDPEEIFVEGGGNGESTVSCFVGQDKPVSPIILGKDGSCQKTAEVSGFTPTESASGSPQPAITSRFTATSQASVAGVFTISSPASGSTVDNTLPTIKGEAPPNRIIQIEVHSAQPISATVKSDSLGNWSFLPPEVLSAGQHSIIVSFIDDLGRKQTLTRSFTVLAAGAEPLIPVTTATPEAIPVPVPIIPVATPAPVIVNLPATPAANPYLPPTTGDFTQTFWMLLLGAVFILGGLLPSRKFVGGENHESR